MVRVWFNHWFSTSYRLIELMKEDKEESIYVIGSNEQIDSVIQVVCDEWYQEPVLYGEAYIQYCLDFCVAHQIDVFVPRRGMVMISKAVKRFETMGVKVMVDDYETIERLNNKALAYDYFKDIEGLHIPSFFSVTDVDAFIHAYEVLQSEDETVCIKFVEDEGGMSFRKVVSEVNPFKQLSSYPSRAIAYDTLVEVLAAQGSFKPLMVMPYLSGREISVDCLDTAKGLIAIPRIKSYSRHEMIDYPTEILNKVQQMMKKLKLAYPCNFQFRMKDEKPYLLEVNTRMSGGLQMSCLAAKVNVPNIALNKILGKDIDWTMDKTKQIVSYIEIPKVIRRIE